MKGYQSGASYLPNGSGELSDEEIRAAEAVGELIAFWGFKKGHGQIWTVLYLRDLPMTAKEIQNAFSMSKGGVSQLLKDLEEWRVVQRHSVEGQRAMVFSANTNLLEMIALVFQKRELMVLEKVILALKAVENSLSYHAPASRATLQRVARMRRSGENVLRAIRVFLRTARLDLTRLQRNL
ncbi:MAG: hypothetical protein CMH56_01130 [Myxococcales bacterium]|nr:hypothetical protein [Myxococcales bacterium]